MHHSNSRCKCPNKDLADTSRTNRESATISHKDKLVQLLPPARRRKVSCQ